LIGSEAETWAASEQTANILTMPVNKQTNRTLFVLTVVTVPALPLTIIPGLFGMNVGGVPFAAHNRGFWLVSALLTVWVSVGATLVLRRRRNS
jgi:zinc transporter